MTTSSIDAGTPRPNGRRQARCALSTMASNTGCTSDGELAITFRMSAVAVCRSSASLRLVEQPHVLDGDHRLIGEGPQQLDVVR